MKAEEYLSRHGLRAARVFVAGIACAALAIGAAKADIAPHAGSDLARAILGSMPQPAPVVAEPAAPPPPVIAFMVPVKGYAINSNFGLRRLPQEPAARMHEGVDIAAPSGVAIHCTAPGEVTKAGTSPTYGNYVEVDHGNGISSFYAHMKRATPLRLGAQVEAGDVVGQVGSTGHSTGSHLHFEIRRNGLHFDPMLFVDKTFATLDALPFVRSAEFGFRRAAAHGARVYRTASHRGKGRRSGGRSTGTIHAR